MIDKFDGEYRFLSNFYVCQVTYNDITYKSSEHAYQASKAANKEDHDAIMNTNTPGQAKRLGAKIKIKPNWDNIKISIMIDILLCKFNQNKDLMIKLINTGDSILIEGNHWGDVYWGICDGVGKNHLGKILMDIRNLNVL